MRIYIKHVDPSMAEAFIQAVKNVRCLYTSGAICKEFNKLTNTSFLRARGKNATFQKIFSFYNINNDDKFYLELTTHRGGKSVNIKTDIQKL